MKGPVWYKLILLLALGAVFTLMLFAWHERGLDLARAEAEIAAQKELAEGLRGQARMLEEREKQRAEETDQQLAAMREAVAKVTTPQQIVQWIPQQPGFQALKLELPPATPENPTPPAAVSIPQAELPVLLDTIEKCIECDLKLRAAEEDSISKAERLRLAGEQMLAVQRQRDAALRAARGGGFWMRVKRNAKWFGIGAAAGFAASRAR